MWTCYKGVSGLYENTRRKKTKDRYNKIKVLIRGRITVDRWLIQYKYASKGISVVEIRRSFHRHICITGFPIFLRQHMYIESGLRVWRDYHLTHPTPRTPHPTHPPHPTPPQTNPTPPFSRSHTRPNTPHCYISVVLAVVWFRTLELAYAKPQY